jgi:hypothetical protein
MQGVNDGQLPSLSPILGTKSAAVLVPECRVSQPNGIPRKKLDPKPTTFAHRDGVDFGSRVRQISSCRMRSRNPVVATPNGSVYRIDLCGVAACGNVGRRWPRHWAVAKAGLNIQPPSPFHFTSAVEIFCSSVSVASKFCADVSRALSARA